MTALCGGGPSQKLPLTPDVIDITGAGAAALAVFWGFPELAAIIAVAVGALNFASTIVCSTDPPPDPGLTPTDVINAIDVMNPGLAIPAQARVQQWFLHRYWFDICTCSSSTTPPPPAMSNPNTPIGVNTGAPSGLNAPPCWTITAHHTEQITQMFGKVIVMPWLPSGEGSRITLSGVNAPFVCIPPPGFNLWSWTFTHGSSSHGNVVSLEGFTQSGAGSHVADIADSAISGPQTGSVVFAASTGFPYLGIRIDSNPAFSGNWTADWSGTLSITCTGAPPNQLIQPCCPPDPLIDIKLDQIFGLVLNLYNRGSGDLAGYTKGTAHLGVTGSGSFAASNLAGVLVEITAAPPTKVQPGNPSYIWDMGWLSCSTPDGFIDEKRLTRTKQIWLPRLMPLSDSFGFYLFPGVVATITELLPA